MKTSCYIIIYPIMLPNNTSVLSPISRCGSCTPTPTLKSNSPVLSVGASPVSRSLCTSPVSSPLSRSPLPFWGSRKNSVDGGETPPAALKGTVNTRKYSSKWTDFEQESAFTAQLNHDSSAKGQNKLSLTFQPNLDSNTIFCEKGIDVYRTLLKLVLSSGYITSGEKEKLKRYRTAHQISTKDHQDLLDDLKWSSEEFKRGYQRLDEDLLGYEQLLRKELRNGRLSHTGSMKLRRYRASAGVNMDTHLTILKNLGWTGEEFEAGLKSSSYDGKEESSPSECEVHT